MDIPKHITVFFDGNRRWARERGLDPLEGHLAGFKKALDFTDWCMQRGIQCLTGYGFSTENWNRTPREVSYLMRLLEQGLREQFERYGNNQKGVRMRVLGQKERLPAFLQKTIKEIEEATKDNKKFFLNLAVSYGGRWDILNAVQKIAEQKILPKDISEELFSAYLSTAGLPEPDLMIRFGGEQRFSNFLLWQQAYTELCFVKKYWPDVTEQDLDDAIAEYQKRQRRFGK
jgi:undecaprenyl diphosphate synthase